MRKFRLGGGLLAFAVVLVVVVSQASAHYHNNPAAHHCRSFYLTPGSDVDSAFGIRAYRASCPIARSLAYKKLDGEFQEEPKGLSEWRCIHRLHRHGLTHTDYLCRKSGGRRITFALA